ncbi:MAG: hypothetical protein ACM3MB_11215 [Acidobacteriota bacterium]
MREAGDCKIIVLHPHREFYTRDGNEYDKEYNSSLVLSIKGRREVFLFPGDTGEEAEQDIWRWFAVAMLTGRYSGSPESMFDLDMKAPILDSKG